MQKFDKLFEELKTKSPEEIQDIFSGIPLPNLLSDSQINEYKNASDDEKKRISEQWESGRFFENYNPNDFYNNRMTANHILDNIENAKTQNEKEKFESDFNKLLEFGRTFNSRDE